VRADDLSTTTPPPATPTPAAVPTPEATPVEPAAAQPADVPAAETVAAATTPSVLSAAAAPAPAAPATQRTSDPVAPATSDVAAPDAGAAPAGQTQSAGAGTSSQQGSTDGGSSSAPAPVVTTGAPTAAAPLLAPVADVDGATGASATQPVSAQVARQVAVLADGPDGAHTMTLVLTPDSVGPVEVQVTLQKGTIDLHLRGAHEHGRAALLEALPDLRRDLEAAGLTTSRLEVDRDSGGAWLGRHSAQQQAQQQAMTQQQGFGDRGNRQETGDGRSRPWGRPADTGVSGPAPSTNRSTSSGVDYRV
jgi:flagellar hook-length control protein FliK